MKYASLLFVLFLGLIASASAASVYLFDTSLLAGTSLATNAPDRIGCNVVASGGLGGGPSISVSALAGVLMGDNCYIQFINATADLTEYTEIEFFIKASPINSNQGYAGFFLVDIAEDSAGPNIPIPTTYTRFRFPLQNTFSPIDLTEIISPFYLNLYLVQGESLTVDNIVLRNRNYFDIFTDSTSNGREIIISWAGTPCTVVSGVGAPEGSEALLVPANTWGCGLFYNTPDLDLSAFSSIRFMLKSSVPSLLEIETASGKTGVQIPSTNNNWKSVNIDLSQFNLDFTHTTGAFLLTKVGDATGQVLVDRIRYYF